MKRFVLNDNVIFRQENFGSILININERKVRMFNEAATNILQNLKSSKTLDELANSIGYSNENNEFHLEDFLNELIDKKAVSTTFENKTTKAGIYFEQIDDFPEGYYYSPLGVEIEYTMKCSRNCIYCAYSSNPFVDVSKELTPIHWFTVLQDLKRSGVIFIRFTGGDPLTREDFFEVLKMADEMNFIISIGSDLTILKEKHANALSSMKNLIMVQTTLDGSTAEINDKMRGPGNFKKVLEGMQLLKRYKIPFIVGTVLRKGNIYDIENIGRLAAENYASGYCFAPLYAAGRAKGLDDMVPNNEDLFQANLQLKKLVVENIVKPSDWVWYDTVINKTDEDLRHLLDNQPYISRVPDRLLRIDPKGNCYSSIKLTQYLTDSEVYAGNIMDQGVMEIWHGSNTLNYLRNLKTQKTFFGNTTDLRQISNLKS